MFSKKNEILVPVLVVTNKSSVSCVCSKLGSGTFTLGDEILAKAAPVKPKDDAATKKETAAKEKAAAKPAAGQAPAEDSGLTQVEKSRRKQKMRIRLSAGSYTNLSDRGDHTRMRYSFTMQGNNIRNSRFSTDVNVVFRHTLGEWNTVNENLNDALKVYALAGKFDVTESSNVVLGRKINPRIASIGAIDGIQFEKSLGQFMVGAIGGSRPDYLDYSWNPELFQAGIYGGYESKMGDPSHQTTLGVMEQHNKSAIDRRFVYLQHSNNLLTNLNLFSSCELDLYEKVNNETKNTPSLTNLFVSLQYRFSKKVNATLSYDNRRNIIYYESYKSYIDQLIEDETRQGMRFGLNLRPFKMVSIGANASWRFQKSNANDSKNLNAYVNFNRVPVLNTSVSLTANFLQTSYINSKIYGVRLTENFLKGKGNAELYYRLVQYDYPIYEYSTNQHVVGASVSIQVLKGLAIYLFAEHTLDSQNNNYTLINTKLMQRF
ncbi:MAG: hypothetical protein IT270_01135 [Saprospiraceae bacterium]|nr:hypothetical protein [Saprospiraceae bacterium]